jgi:hypothetical protein
MLVFYLCCPNLQPPRRVCLKFLKRIQIGRTSSRQEQRFYSSRSAALLERTSVPEYREAIIAMAKAWMKIAERAKAGNWPRATKPCYKRKSIASKKANHFNVYGASA